MTRTQAALEAALAAVDSPERPTPDQLGLTPEELTAHQADIQALCRPPVTQPDGFDVALIAALSVGLIAPISLRDNRGAYLVHRWTATAINHLEPDLTALAHHRAARYFRWRVQMLPQSEHDDVDDLIEARHHHHAAGEHDAALELSDQAIVQLQTWGQYGHASELCRQPSTGYRPTPPRPPPTSTSSASSPSCAGTTRPLSSTSPNRSRSKSGSTTRPASPTGTASWVGSLSCAGDYDTAEQRYTQSLEISERLGDQARIATGYHNLGILAQDRGDYDTAEQRYTQSLEIDERLGDQARIATGYHNLGILAQDRGDYDTAEQRYTQSLEIDERLGNQAGLADSYHNLGVLAQLHGDYDTAEQRYTQSLGDRRVRLPHADRPDGADLAARGRDRATTRS
jgi:tetratricopeptide (TPR) repeat protein